jgi:hypothetical protein
MDEEWFKPGLELVLPKDRGAHGSPPTEVSQREKAVEPVLFLNLPK